MARSPSIGTQSARVMSVRVPDADRRRLEAAARMNKQRVSEFVRDAVADRVDATLNDDEDEDQDDNP